MLLLLLMLMLMGATNIHVHITCTLTSPLYLLDSVLADTLKNVVWHSAPSEARRIFKSTSEPSEPNELSGIMLV